MQQCPLIMGTHWLGFWVLNALSLHLPILTILLTSHFSCSIAGVGHLLRDLKKGCCHNIYNHSWLEASHQGSNYVWPSPTHCTKVQLVNTKSATWPFKMTACEIASKREFTFKDPLSWYTFHSLAHLMCQLEIEDFSSDNCWRNKSLSEGTLKWCGLIIIWKSIFAEECFWCFCISCCFTPMAFLIQVNFSAFSWWNSCTICRQYNL